MKSKVFIVVLTFALLITNICTGVVTTSVYAAEIQEESSSSAEELLQKLSDGQEPLTEEELLLLIEAGIDITAYLPAPAPSEAVPESTDMPEAEVIPAPSEELQEEPETPVEIVMPEFISIGDGIEEEIQVLGAETYEASGNSTSGLQPATNLHWDGYNAVFDVTSTDAFYFLYIYRNDNPVVNAHIGKLNQGNHSFRHPMHFQEEGNYRFKVKTGSSDNDWDRDSGVLSEWSDMKSFTPADTKLGTPQNLRWSSSSTGTAEWDAVDGAGGYTVSLLKNGEYVTSITSYYYNNGTKRDLLEKIGDTSDADYTFKVQALSLDPALVMHGEVSGASPVLVVGNGGSSGDNSGSIYSQTNNQIQGTSAQDAYQIIQNMKNQINLTETQAAMQTTESVRKEIRELEDTYKGQAGINVKVTVTDEAGISKSGADIQGAALNAQPGANVEFTIDRAGTADNHVIDTNIYKNVARFDMNISDVDMDPSGNLRFPVTVTIPVPSYIQNRLTAKVLHFHHSDSGYDLISPRFNSDGTMSFTVTHFSELAIAESYINGWINQFNKSFWHESGIKQGTSYDPKGVTGDGTVRGREIYDPASNGWYWLDSIYDGAKAVDKEVWMPYIYQDEAGWNDSTIANIAKESNSYTESNVKAQMGPCVERAIRNREGKWVRYDQNGKMVKGWYTVEGRDASLYPSQAGNTYFYDYKTGLMAKGKVIIDGTEYAFDEVTGVLKK